jgi:hypothetical protein
MPRRNGFSSILIVGAGPMVIGRAAELEHSATEAGEST